MMREYIRLIENYNRITLLLEGFTYQDAIKFYKEHGWDGQKDSLKL